MSAGPANVTCPPARKLPVSENSVCRFCPPEKDLIIFRTKEVTAFYDKFPVTPGHALVITTVHRNTWMDATADEKKWLTWGVDLAIDCIKKRFPDDELGFNIGVNVGKLAGQTVPHLHVHVIPRRSGDNGSDPRGGVRGVIPRKKVYDDPQS